MRRFCAACFLWLGLGLLGMLSCQRLQDDQPSWNMQLLAPLLQTRLTLHDLLADSLLQVNDDQSLSLVYRRNFYEAKLSDLALQVPDTLLRSVFSLNNINLSNQTLVYPYSLGAMCAQLGVLGLIIIGNQGQYFTIPPLTGLSVPDNLIDASLFFEYAQIKSGYIDITLENGLPLTWNQIVFEIRNFSDQQVVLRDTFADLTPFEKQIQSVDLSGKHVEGLLVARIIDMSSPGGTVLIDTSDAIVLTLQARDLSVYSATAVFPAQDIIREERQITYRLTGGAELNQLQVRSGVLQLRMTSSVDQQLRVTFELPSALGPQGQSVSLQAVLPAAPAGGTVSYMTSIDLSDYSFDLTGAYGNELNTLRSLFVVRMDSTGQLTTISDSDSVTVEYELLDLQPAYVRGYLGQQIATFGPEEKELHFLPIIAGGRIAFDQASISLRIANGLGAPLRFRLYELLSINSQQSQTVGLSWDQMGKPLDVGPATENPYQVAQATYQLNPWNSNVAAFVSNIPDKVRYRMDVFLNPLGNSNHYGDFAVDTARLTFGLDAEIPLSLSASDLILIDTLEFSPARPPEPGNAYVRSGVFTLHVDNGFPLQVALQLYFCSPDLQIVDSLFTTHQTIAAAAVDASCRVSAAKSSQLTASIGEQKMQRLWATEKTIVRAVLQTTTGDLCQQVMLYEDYGLDLRFTGSFTYYTGN